MGSSTKATSEKAYGKGKYQIIYYSPYWPLPCASPRIHSSTTFTMPQCSTPTSRGKWWCRPAFPTTKLQICVWCRLLLFCRFLTLQVQRSSFSWDLPHLTDVRLAGKNRHCFAWIKIGLAVRFAQDMKFMLESAHDLPFAVQEERRRVFWSVYLLDRLVSCGRARPPAILDASCQLQLPSDEDTWRSGAWKEVLTLQQLSYRELSTPEQLGPFSHVVAMAYTLGRAAQYMLQQFNTRSQDPPWGANSDFVAIQSDLVYLETVLQMSKSPTDLVAEHTSPGGRHIDQHAIGPAIFSRALFHLTYCLLHHPFLLRKRLESCQIAAPSTFLTRAFETAWEHSRRMTKLLQEAQEAGAMLRASFYGYCMVVAGSIAALHLHDVSDAKRAESADLVRANTSIIEKIGRHWRNVSLMVCIVLHFPKTS